MKVCFSIFVISIGLILIIPIKALDITVDDGFAVTIQEAVDQVAAAGGGTVYVPEGDFLFNPTEEGAVKIPGGVNLIGAGKDKTIFRNTEPVPYDEWGWGRFFLVDGSQQNGKSVQLSGFTIIGFRELYPDHDARTRGITIRQVKDFLVSDIKIKDVGGGGITVNGWRSYGDAITRGVITHCDLINTNGFPMGPGAIASGPNVLGYGVAVDGFGRPEEWIDDISQVLGKYDYGQPVVYIEDCYFSRWRHCIASNQVGHYVSRYNTFDEYSQGFGDVDAHGAGYGNYGTGTRAIEVYNNTFLTPTPAGSWTMAVVFHRGGGGVYFNNTVKSGRGAFIYFSNDGTGWDPRLEVEKYFSNDVWVWNNNIASGVTEIIKYDPEGLIIEDENYYRNAPSFDYTPYSYPHPLTLGEIPTTTTTTIPPGQVTVSGRLVNNNNQPVNARVITYNKDTSQENASDTTVNGDYTFNIWPDIYDLQYNILDIPNLFIKLLSLSIISNPQNIVDNFNSFSNGISFEVDISEDQEIQVYSDEKPKSVKANDLELTEATLPISTNEWYYDEANDILHMKVSLPTSTTTTTSTSSTTTFSTSTTIPSDGVIFTDGFESGFIVEPDGVWTGTQSYGGTSLDVTSNEAYTGIYCLNTTYTTGERAWWQNNVYKNFETRYEDVYARLYFNAKYLPSDGKRLHLMSFFGNGTTDYGDLQFLSIVNNGGTYQLSLYYRVSGFSSDATYDIPSISTETWYSVEMRRKCSDSGMVSIWWDGSLVIDETGDLYNAENGWINSIHVSMDPRRNDGTDWVQSTLFDDVVVSKSYIGP